MRGEESRAGDEETKNSKEGGSGWVEGGEEERKKEIHTNRHDESASEKQAARVSRIPTPAERRARREEPRESLSLTQSRKSERGGGRNRVVTRERVCASSVSESQSLESIRAENKRVSSDKGKTESQERESLKRREKRDSRERERERGRDSRERERETERERERDEDVSE